MSVGFGFGAQGSNTKSHSQGIFNFQKKFLRTKLLPRFDQEYDSQLPVDSKPSSDLASSSLLGLENAFSSPSGTDALGQASRSRLMDFITGGEGFDKYFRATVSDPLMEQYRQEIIPQTKLDFLGDLSGSQALLGFKTGENRLLDTLAREKTRVETEGLFQALNAAGSGAASPDITARLQASQAAIEQQKLLEEIRARRSEQLLNAVLGGGGFSKSKGKSRGFNISGSASMGGMGGGGA